MSNDLWCYPCDFQCLSGSTISVDFVLRSTVETLSEDSLYSGIVSACVWTFVLSSTSSRALFRRFIYAKGFEPESEHKKSRSVSTKRMRITTRPLDTNRQSTPLPPLPQPQKTPEKQYILVGVPCGVHYRPEGSFLIFFIVIRRSNNHDKCLLCCWVIFRKNKDKSSVTRGGDWNHIKIWLCFHNKLCSARLDTDWKVCGCQNRLRNGSRRSILFSKLFSFSLWTVRFEAKPL